MIYFDTKKSQMTICLSTSCGLSLTASWQEIHPLQFMENYSIRSQMRETCSVMQPFYNSMMSYLLESFVSVLSQWRESRWGCIHAGLWHTHCQYLSLPWLDIMHLILGISSSTSSWNIWLYNSIIYMWPNLGKETLWISILFWDNQLKTRSKW